MGRLYVHPLMILSHLLHIQLLGSFLERVSNQTTAEMGEAGGVITSLYRAAEPKHDELFLSFKGLMI
jgi:hypothetical protein